MKVLALFSAAAVLIAAVAVSQTPRDGRDGRRPGPPPRDPVLQLFDTDENGEISTREMENATAVLKKRDRDGDGVLTRDELPAHRDPATTAEVSVEKKGRREVMITAGETFPNNLPTRPRAA